ncbi:MAG: BLUF domain-containing protein [Janthinobacterium lividum]
MNQLYRVIYCSRNEMPPMPDGADAGIRDILENSRRNNELLNVTGGLLFSEGCFAQVLEGPIGAVTDTFERIQMDERHGTVTVLQAEHITSREFPSWSMGYAGPNPSQTPLSGFGLTAAVSGQTRSGQDMLDMLKGVIVREDDRLLPS